MRLDELKWEVAYLDDNNDPEWMEANFGHPEYLIYKRVDGRFDYAITTGSGFEPRWLRLEPIAAQAILYHLLDTLKGNS